MAKASLSLVPPGRTPERQRLADAIAERDRRLALVDAKRAEIEALKEPRYALWQQRDELEGQAQRLNDGRHEVARRDALLRGEAIPPEDDVEVVRARLAEVSDALARLAKTEAELETDIQLLSPSVALARSVVEDAAAAVLVADPVYAVLVAELQRLEPRVTMLRQAIGNTFGAWALVDSYLAAETLRGWPCPWNAARDRLASDPDARLPMPEDVFAEPPPRSAA